MPASEGRFTYETVSTPAGPLYRLQSVSECSSSSSCAGTADEIVTTYTYWSTTFLKTSETRQPGNGGSSLTNAYAYDDAGRLVQETRPGGAATAFFYDGVGRRKGSIGHDPDGGGALPRLAQRITYDPDDQITRIEDGTATAATDAALAAILVSKVTDFNYDSAGLKDRETVTGSTGTIEQVTQYSYDAVGRLECTAVRMNRSNYSSLPASACSLSQPAHPTFGPDRITRNVYDAAGQLRIAQKAYATPLQQDYAAYTYTPNGKLQFITDANGNRAELRYDGHDRQSCWIFPSKTTAGALGGDCSTGDFESYGYDANANRTSLRKRDGVTLVYAYDALNRMSQKTVPASATGAAGYSVHYGYDLRGLQTFARFGSVSGPGITNAWDGFGRLASSATSMDGVSRAMTSQYDADGNRTALSGDQGYYAPFSYDGLGRMSAYANLALFAYDAAGRRSSLAMGPGWTSSTIGYAYDPAGRLQTLTHDLGGTSGDQSQGFAYNPASQIVTRSGSNDAYASNTAYNVSRAYSVNGLNQYTTAGPASFLYDANGNLTSDGSTAFVYDSENRLVAASGAKNAALAYDPLGRLWQVTSGASTTRFLYDGDRLAMEYNGSGAVIRSYVHGPGADEPLVWYEASAGWARRFFHADHQGSIVSLNDDAGTPVAINGYDAWGIPNEARAPQAANVGRFGYTGQAWIPELGLWYYKARFYSPTTGRFMQVDPIGYSDQINLYAYVHNDPMNRADPSGLSDVNMIEEPHDRAANARIDFPNAFTISAHGSTFGVMDETKRSLQYSDGNARYNAEQTLEVARANGYKGGLTIFIVCNIGTPPPGKLESFAQDYADRSEGKVVATTGLMAANLSGSRITLSTVRGSRGPSGIYLFEKGKAPKYLGERLNYDPKQGIWFDNTKTKSRR